MAAVTSKSIAHPMICRCILAYVALCCFSSATHAQTRSSRLLGVVTGAGRPVGGVQVRLSRAGTYPGAEAATDARGRFSFVGLSWGAYVLDFSREGWQSHRLPHIELASNTTLNVSITLSRPASTRVTPEHYLDQDVWWGTQFTELATEKQPNGRNIWSLLQSQEPSTVTNRLDIGGLETGVPALFGALGASWTENQYTLNAFNVTDPYQPGFPLLDPGIDDVAEFQVVTGSKPPVFYGSGEDMWLGTPQAPETFHGAARVFYSGDSLQSDNMNARLQHFHFPGAERLNHLADANAQVGGKLPLASLPFFASLSTQQLSKNLGGFAAPINASVYRALFDVTAFSRGSQRLTFLYFGQHVTNSRENPEFYVAPSATTRGNDNFHQFQSRWTKTAGTSTLFSAGFGVVNAIVSSTFQNGALLSSTLDLPSMTLAGAAPLATSGLRTRYEGQAGGQTVLHAAGTHSLSFGLDWDRANISNRWNAASNQQQITVSGVSSEVIRWNTPAIAHQRVQNLGDFIQDAWRSASWFSLFAGLRLDTSTGQADGNTSSLFWNTLQPHIGLVIALPPRGMFIQAQWARYGHVLQGRYLDFGNQTALAGQVFRWRDLNGDGIAQPQELGPLLLRFGGPYSAIDPHLARPYTDEISFGLEQDLGLGFMVSGRFFRRDDHRQIALNNIGVPVSDYTPVQFLDPGDDGIFGTPDDQALTLYNRKTFALGRDFLLLTNRFHDSYKGVELRLAKRLLHTWEFAAAFTASRSLAFTSPGNSVFQDDPGFVGNLGADPNTLLFAEGRTHFDRDFTGKLSAYYNTPFHFHVGAVASYYDGLPFGRLILINGFNQGPFFVRAEPVGHPGGFQTQLNASFDGRLSRDFAVNKGILSAYLDVFNILNANSNTREADLTGAAFLTRVPLEVESPRTARLGIEWRF